MVKLANGNYTVYGPPPPSSGVVMQYIMKILDGMTYFFQLSFASIFFCTAFETVPQSYQACVKFKLGLINAVYLS